jgi:2'-5' RNA ligase
MNKKYVAIYYNSSTQERLRTWSERNGFDLSVKYDGSKQNPSNFYFHTTIFYSQNEVDLRNKVIYNEKEDLVIPTGFDLLGPNKDIVVLKLAYVGELKQLREYYERLGLKDQWDSYKPHISVSYDRKPRNLNDLELPLFSLAFDRIIIEDLVE